MFIQQITRLGKNRTAAELIGRIFYATMALSVDDEQFTVELMDGRGGLAANYFSDSGGGRDGMAEGRGRRNKAAENCRLSFLPLESDRQHNIITVDIRWSCRPGRFGE